MRQAQDKGKEAALAEGVKIAREMFQQVKRSVQGVQVSAPFARMGRRGGDARLYVVFAGWGGGDATGRRTRARQAPVPPAGTVCSPSPLARSPSHAASARM